MRPLWAGVVFAALALFCGVASAQSNEAARAAQQQNRIEQLQQFEIDTRLLVNPDIPPGQRALIDYGGYFSPQYYSIDDSNHDNHGLREYDLVGYLHINFDGANEVFFLGRLQYNDFNAGDSFDGFGSRLIDPNGDYDRAFYKFDLQKYEAAYNGKHIDEDIAFEGGRDLVYWANGLVMAQVVDGVMPSVSFGSAAITGVAGVTPTRTVDFEPDRPDFDYNTRRGFFGAMLSVAVGQQHPYIYGLVQRDFNDRNLSIIGPIATRYSYNSDYFGVGSTGPLSDHVRYGIEAVVEGGNDLSDSSQVSGFTLVPVPQTRDNILAYAGDAKIDYVPQDVNNSRVTIEGIVASGDTDRGLTNTTFNGNAPGTTDRAFNAFGLLSTGLAFGSAVSNLMVLRVGPSTFPFPTSDIFRRFQVGADVYVFAKENSQAPIDQPTTPGVKFLGWEPDAYVNWEITSDVTLTARYGAFFGNPAAFLQPRARQFLYTGATFAF
ncbi:MAG: hypothetical protein ABSB74_20160 [Tepidisphaeraceae bacterium]